MTPRLTRNEFCDAWQQGYDYRLREEAKAKGEADAIPAGVIDIAACRAARIKNGRAGIRVELRGGAR